MSASADRDFVVIRFECSEDGLCWMEMADPRTDTSTQGEAN